MPSPDSERSTTETSAEERHLGDSARLESLDALRGFDMFWIVGGSAVFVAMAKAIGPGFHEWAVANTEHPAWNGYTPWDQIFPLFMFVAGVAMPFSLTKRVERNESRAALHWHVIQRGLILVLLGMIYNGLLLFDFEQLRYPSVLGRIGLGYLFAGLIVLNTRVRGQILCVIGLLVGYWAAMRFIPVPEYGAGDWEPGHTLVGYVDRMVLPGTLYKTIRDPEGLLSTIPSIATVLMGALAGHWLRLSKPSGHEKAALLVISGIISLILASVWNIWFPINKNLWTSSFVLHTSGWSLLLLAVFYLIIDVWRFKRWAFFFTVIGMNAITVYLVRGFVDFKGIAEIVFARAAHGVHPALMSGGELLLVWLMLYAMYRGKIFLRV